MRGKYTKRDQGYVLGRPFWHVFTRSFPSEREDIGLFPTTMGFVLDLLLGSISPASLRLNLQEIAAGTFSRSTGSNQFRCSIGSRNKTIVRSRLVPFGVEHDTLL